MYRQMQQTRKNRGNSWTNYLLGSQNHILRGIGVLSHLCETKKVAHHDYPLKFLEKGRASDGAKAAEFAGCVFFNRGINPIYRQNVRDSLTEGELEAIVNWRRGCEENNREEICRYFVKGIATDKMLFAGKNSVGWERLGLQQDFRTWFKNLPIDNSKWCQANLHHNLSKYIELNRYKEGSVYHGEKYCDGLWMDNYDRDEFVEFVVQWSKNLFRKGTEKFAGEMMFGAGYWKGVLEGE